MMTMRRRRSKMTRRKSNKRKLGKENKKLSNKHFILNGMQVEAPGSSIYFLLLSCYYVSG